MIGIVHAEFFSDCEVLVFMLKFFYKSIDFHFDIKPEQLNRKKSVNILGRFSYVQ